MRAGLASHADKSAKFFFGSSTALLALVLVIAIIASFQGEDTPVPVPSPTAPSGGGAGGNNTDSIGNEVELPPHWPELEQFVTGTASVGEQAVFHKTLAQMARIAYCQNSDYCPEHAGATVEGWKRGRLESTPPAGLQAITFVDDYDKPTRCVIAFRGTSLNTSRGDGLADLCANLYMREGALYRDLPDACRNHFPEFILNYRARAVDFVKTVLFGFRGVGVVVTGHSLGGQLAMHSALHIKDVPISAVAFSTAPHVGLESDDLSNNRFVRVIADRYDPVMQSSQRPWINASVCTYRQEKMPISCFACYKENHTSFDMDPDSSIGFDWMLSGACGACFYETHYFAHVLDLVFDSDVTRECAYYAGMIQPIQSAVWEDVQLFEARTFPKPPEAPVTVPIGALDRQVPPGWEDTELGNVNGLSIDELQGFVGDFLHMSMIVNCYNAPGAMCQIENGVDAKLDGWVRGPEEQLPEYGMHAITFFDDAENPQKIVIAYRGTDFTIDRIDARADLCATDIMLSGEWTTSVNILANCTSLNRTALQYMDRAEEFARHVQMRYPEAGLVFTGHSIGGMLALHSALHVTEWNTAAVAFSPSTSTRHGFDTFWGKRRFAWVFSDINDPMMLLSSEKEWVGDICLFNVDTHMNCEVCREDFLKQAANRELSVTSFLGSQSCNLCLDEAHPISHLRELLSMGHAPDCWHYGNAE